MNLQASAILVLAFFFSLLAVLRTYRRRRWVTASALLLPVLFFSVRWARYREAWLELASGIGIAILGILVWWVAYGRKIPPPQESSIRVWSEEDPF